ncbi:MAG: PA0069 family radical SAM protein [Rhodocyclaceae bacterium]|nr:PA0069 family radical SAM protein [Rhodocyclaceae bacterium]
MVDPPRGRGTTANPDNRYATWQRETTADGWWREEEAPPATVTFLDCAKSVISRNDSPDLPFDRSINPYRGCEHGCIYCYARPSHAWIDLSPGLDFETRIGVKEDAAQRLRQELARPDYRRETLTPLALGVNTDAWQPLERRLGITRQILGVLAECNHPLMLITKGSALMRDLDLLGNLARRDLVHAAVSISTLDAALARQLEPRAATPRRRLQMIAALAEAGIPVTIMVSPVIPGLTDHELEDILDAAANAGARWARYALLRLPKEVDALFRDWLNDTHPDRAGRVLSLLTQMRGGASNNSDFHTRLCGQGSLARLLAQRFALSCRRLGLDKEQPGLDCSSFRPPDLSGQGDLF